MEGGIVGSVCFLACLMYLPNNVFMEEHSTPVPAEKVLSPAETMKLMSLKADLINNAHTNATDDSDNRRSGSGSREVQSSYVTVDGTQKITAFLYPHQIKGSQQRTTLQCTEEGEMYYISDGYDCYVCACVYEGRGVSPRCVRCSDCIKPRPAPPLPITTTRRPRPTPPAPTTLPTPPPATPPPSCAPFEEGEYFENPLNPCQICVCWVGRNTFGAPDIQIVCEENPQCVTITTTSGPTPPATRAPPPPTRTTDYPWPTTVRPPQGSCAPYQPNVPYTNPENDCEVCVCREYKSMQNTEIDIICKTSPECCIINEDEYHYLNELCRYHRLDVPFAVSDYVCKKFICRIAYDQVYAEIIDDQNCNRNDLHPDPICQSYSPGTEFIHPTESCKVCTCEIVGSLVIPVCKKSISCSQQIIVPAIKIEVVFLAPFCKFQPPHQDFTVECSVCRCSPIYNYVIANCRPQNECGAISGSHIGHKHSLIEAHNHNGGVQMVGSSADQQFHIGTGRVSAEISIGGDNQHPYPNMYKPKFPSNVNIGGYNGPPYSNLNINIPQPYKDKSGAPDRLEPKSGRPENENV